MLNFWGINTEKGKFSPGAEHYFCVQKWIFLSVSYFGADDLLCIFALLR